MYDNHTYRNTSQCKCREFRWKSVQTMETGNELFITLEENTRYRWNVNDSAEKNSVVHLDTSGGDNCRFRLDHIENDWY